MNNKEIKNIIIKLVNDKHIASNSLNIVNKFKSIILESDIDTVTNVVSSRQVLENFRRRKTSLTINNTSFFGLEEVLLELESLDSNIKLIHSNYKDYNITFFLDEKYKLILGILVIEK